MTAAVPPVFAIAEEAQLVEVLRQGVRDADAGRPDVAERVFREVFIATRGSGTRVERFACSCLVKLYARQDRDIEVLVLARRHVRLAVALRDVEAQCLAYAGLGDAFVRIEEWTRVEEVVEEFDRTLTHYRGQYAVPLRRCLFRLRAERALASDDVAAAREAIARLADVDPGAPDAPEESRATRLFEAEIALRSGRPDLAREALSGAALEGAPAGGDTLEGACLAVKCTLEIHGARVAAVEIARLLQHLEAPHAASLGTASRARCARRLAEMAASGCGDTPLAKRAYDVAAAAMLLRAAEIERAVRELPELVSPETEDAATLVAYRHRFVEVQRELLNSVGRLLVSRAERGESPNWTHGLAQGAVPVCAWCLRVRLHDGTVLPLGHFVSSDPLLRVSHGICRECVERVAPK